MNFVLVRPVRHARTFARGRGIRELVRLNRIYGRGNWRKRKGVATVRLENGLSCEAEVHWYEAAGIGRKELKIKAFLD